MTHTTPFSFSLHDNHGGFSVIGLSAFNDNYIWLLRAEATGALRPDMVVVDPGDAAPVIAYCLQHGLMPTQIWLTHHHADHVGGVVELQRWADSCGQVLNICGPAAESIPGVTQPLHGGATLSFGPGMVVSVMSVPGHTRGHLAYFLPGSDKATLPALFCGDVLFGLGCGRLFEGTAVQMFESLGRISALPAETRVYCAHEYTLLNLPFALAVDPENAALQARADTIRNQRAAGQATVPLILADDIATNPFLRCGQPTLAMAAMATEGMAPVAIFTRLRQMRDTFKARQ